MALDGSGGKKEIIRAPRTAYKAKPKPAAPGRSSGAEDRDRDRGPFRSMTISVKPGDSNASIAARLGVSEAIARSFIPVIPRVGTQVTVPVGGAPMPSGRPSAAARELTSGALKPASPTAVRPIAGQAAAGVASRALAPSVSGRPSAAAREITSGVIKRAAAPGTAAAGYDRYVPATGSTINPVLEGQAAAEKRAAGVGVRTEVTLTRGQLGDAARYTAQAMFGGYDARKGTYFTGAYDTSGNLVNPQLQPNILSPAVANFMGLTEDQRISLGYNPLPPYNLGKPGGGGGGGGSGGYSYSYGGGGGYGGGGYASGQDLISWRIGL